jgi:hypothetical protein
MVNKIRMLLALVGFILLMPGLVQANTTGELNLFDLPGTEYTEVISTADAVEDIKPLALVTSIRDEIEPGEWQAEMLVAKLTWNENFRVHGPDIRPLE